MVEDCGCHVSQYDVLTLIITLVIVTGKEYMRGREVKDMRG